MQPKWQRRAALFVLVVYSIDLAWKLVNWRESFGEVTWWAVSLGLTVRFLFMGSLLFLYLRLRKAPAQPVAITKAEKATSFRSMRIVHLILLAAVVAYMFVAERLPTSASQPPAAFVETISMLALATVGIAIGLRKKLLPPAMDALQSDEADTRVLGRWRMANILSFILSLSIALYGLVLRAMGGASVVVWPFFIGSLVLMLIWRPRLGEKTTGPTVPPPHQG